jgi:hypothetical protein
MFIEVVAQDFADRFRAGHVWTAPWLTFCSVGPVRPILGEIKGDGRGLQSSLLSIQLRKMISKFKT